MKKNKQEKKGFAKYLAVLYFLAGIVFCFALLMYLLGSSYVRTYAGETASQVIPQSSLAGIFIILSFGITGISSLLVAWGMWHTKNWSRILASIILIWNLLTYIIDAVRGYFDFTSFVPILLTCLILYILWFHPATKNSFR